jgi:hypothetical protein
MMPILIALLVAFAATLSQPDDRDLAMARTAALFLKKGMTEEQVNELLGGTIYKVRMNRLGGFAVYPNYRLRIDFSYGYGATAARLVRIERLPDGHRQYRYLRELALR